MSMTDAELDALEAAARAATPGEWKTTNRKFVSPISGVEYPAITVDAEDRMVCDAQTRPNDAAHIVATQPARVLPLIEEVRRLRAAVTVRWERRAGGSGPYSSASIGSDARDTKVGIVHDLRRDEWMCVSGFAGHASSYPTEAEAKAALEAAVSRALGLSE